MSDYVKKTIAAYDQSPDKYHMSTNDMTPLKEFNRFIDLLSGKKVLDAGCAFGRDTAAFKERDLEPVGIDLSEGLLNKAQQLYPNLDIQKMDIRDLDFDDAIFDGIWCHAVLLHLKDEHIKQTLREFSRVLRSIGPLFVSFKKGKNTGEVMEDFSSDSSRFYNFKTKETLEPLLKEAGFNIVDMYYVNERELFDSSKRDLDWLHCFAVSKEA